ncbi:GIY-YIG nuclease family protein [Paraburkholderia pallida]|nr:GIY-YIG nuclease family protein [Paraburkholderia pallida]
MTSIRAVSLNDVELAKLEFNREFPRPKVGVVTLSSPFFIVDDFAFASFPNAAAAGVYFVFDRDDNLLYIGKADGLGARLGAHFGWNADRTAGRVKSANLDGAHAVRTIGLPGESSFEAAAIEAYLIRRLDPGLNVIGRDRS